MTADEPVEAEPVANMFDRSLTSEELEDLTDADEAPVAVTFSSQDFDVSGLVRRLDSNSMFIPRLGIVDDRVGMAGFQRGFVWSKAQMDRFIESLLLGYPVPGIFLIKQSEDNRLLVLDGQQRLLTLSKFSEGVHRNRPFVLTNVADEFKGLTYKTLPEALKFKLDDSYMQATIVSADGSAAVDNAIFQIFERLNSGGTQLTPHEIRVALAAGPLIEYLEELNSDVSWRALYGPRSARIRDQELVLRALALYIDAARYSRPLKIFLNSFASKNRQPDEAIRGAGTLFRASCKALIDDGIGQAALRRPDVSQVNAAQAEAVIVGLMHAIDEGGSLPKDLGHRIQGLQQDPEFVHATTRATADNDSVAFRLAKTRQAFTKK
ncbi:hypothetical protein DMP17_28600 [Pseudonocardia sp. TMWB2A]|uniref:DUF262 domain-containing protein n=1 Tax=Pseudonocardia sp. TMWB2A TaxID=687430 RepID=UPI00307FA3FA